MIHVLPLINILLFYRIIGVLWQNWARKDESYPIRLSSIIISRMVCLYLFDHTSKCWYLYIIYRLGNVRCNTDYYKNNDSSYKLGNFYKHVITLSQILTILKPTCRAVVHFSRYNKNYKRPSFPTIIKFNAI